MGRGWFCTENRESHRFLDWRNSVGATRAKGTGERAPGGDRDEGEKERDAFVGRRAQTCLPKCVATHFRIETICTCFRHTLCNNSIPYNSSFSLASLALSREPMHIFCEAHKDYNLVIKMAFQFCLGSRHEFIFLSFGIASRYATTDLGISIFP